MPDTIGAGESATMNTNDPRGAKGTIKQILRSVLPATVVEAILGPWRKFYWWRRLAVNPRRNRRIAAGLVASGKPINLELGSARRDGMEDWVTSDINGGGDIQLDLVDPMPFPDNSVQQIYSSHVIEHFSYPSPMLDVLRECYRILKPGGTIGVAVPNARIFLEGYVNPAQFERERYCTYDVGLSYKTRIDCINFIAYMGGDHKHMFDEESLVVVLAEAGFRGVRLRDYDPALDMAARRHESIYATGLK